MAKYKILISRSAEKKLKSLPKADLVKIVQVIQSLSTNPYPEGAKKLVGEEQTFRIRIGYYRIIYEVYKRKLIIHVLKVGHRKDIYRKL